MSRSRSERFAACCDERGNNVHSAIAFLTTALLTQRPKHEGPNTYPPRFLFVVTSLFFLLTLGSSPSTAQSEVHIELWGQFAAPHYNYVKDGNAVINLDPGQTSTVVSAFYSTTMYSNQSIYGVDTFVGSTQTADECPYDTWTFRCISDGDAFTLGVGVHTFMARLYVVNTLGRRVLQDQKSFTVTVNADPTPAPLSVSFYGPTSLTPSQSGTWTSTTNGGQTPYAYSWEYKYPCPDPDPCTGPVCIEGEVFPMGPQCGVWSAIGSSSSLTYTFSSTFGSVDLRLKVTDAATTIRSSTLRIYYSGSRQSGDDLEGLERGTSANADQRGASELAPKKLALYSPAPNPLRGQAEIVFDLPEAGLVTLAIYDLRGREVDRLANRVLEAGRHRVRFDASDLPSGIYLSRLTASRSIKTQRVTVLK